MSEIEDNEEMSRFLLNCINDFLLLIIHPGQDQEHRFYLYSFI